MPEAQSTSIDRIRADTVAAWRGLVVLVYAPIICLIPLVMPAVRDLPHIHLAPVRSPLVWSLVALGAVGFYAARRGLPGMSAPNLWMVIAGSGLVVIGGPVFAILPGFSPLSRLAHESGGAFVGLAAVGVISAIVIYWLLLSSVFAAIRLLTARVPSDDTPLPVVLASPAPWQGVGERITRHNNKRSLAAVFYRTAGVALASVGLLGWLWFMANPGAMPMAGLSIMVVIIAVAAGTRKLWRLGRTLAAIDAKAALRNDRRRPVLYLRSFRDDPHLTEGEWGMLVRSDGRLGRRRHWGPIARASYRMSTKLQEAIGGGGRVEENLATVVAPIGPFVAFGEPGEASPDLGAARAYFTNDRWQGEVIQWIDMAALIVALAGPTHSLRWELDTIVSNPSCWPKLIILMPPASHEDGIAVWAELVEALQDSPWRDAVLSVEPHEIVAMRLLEDGKLAVVKSGERRAIDYVLSMRILLHQMQPAAPRRTTARSRKR